MTSGMLLRLAGPAMSFGEQAAFTHRPTLPFPSRSAMTGLFASALGRPRHQALDPLPTGDGTSHTFDQLTFTVRVDCPGTLWTDFHTSGGGRGPEQGLRTSAGKYRPASESTHVSWRQYLIGAVFTIAVQGPTPLLRVLADALEHPHYAPYLGRRSCVPTEPLVLTELVEEPVHHLMRHVPLPLTPPRNSSIIAVDFWWEQPPPTGSPPAHAHWLVTDTPADFTATSRRHLTRQLWSTTHQLPARLATGPDAMPALAAYLEDAACP